MNAVPSIDIPSVDGLGIQLLAPSTLRLKGMITLKEPSQELSGFFRTLHAHVLARGLSEFFVDVTELTFVNSSSIRLFIDWAVWVQKQSNNSYVLKFRTNRQVTWQQTAFSAMKSLMKDVVSVEQV